ncbi:MAG: hypothetical protein H6R10_1336 [Rhodocyclaceae bacterium]|nr:hypothetical protein [Rhodocyclaceae bacterium]
MTGIPDFTEAECQLVAKTLDERYGCNVPMEGADVELKLDPDSDRLTACPALYWSQRGAEFVVCKVAPSRFRALFFYDSGEQFGTGRTEYDNLGDCVVTLLQVQADEASGRAGACQSSRGCGGGGCKSSAPYDGPIVI